MLVSYFWQLEIILGNSNWYDTLSFLPQEDRATQVESLLRLRPMNTFEMMIKNSQYHWKYPIDNEADRGWACMQKLVLKLGWFDNIVCCIIPKVRKRILDSKSMCCWITWFVMVSPKEVDQSRVSTLSGVVIFLLFLQDPFAISWSWLYRDCLVILTTHHRRNVRSSTGTENILVSFLRKSWRKHFLTKQGSYRHCKLVSFTTNSVL